MKMNQIDSRRNLRKVLLLCGVISSLLYVSIDIIAALIWKDSYNYASQAFSELMAFEAPTRPFVLSFNILYNVCVIAFALCVWSTNNKMRSLRVTGITLIGYAVIGLVTPTFFPAPMRGVEGTLRNAMHLPLTGLEVLFILSSIVCGAIALGKWFRIYSGCTLLIITFCGVWAGTFVSKLNSDQPTIWLGVIERINIYGFMLWVIILAITLLRMEKSRRFSFTANENIAP